MNRWALIAATILPIPIALVFSWNDRNGNGMVAASLVSGVVGLLAAGYAGKSGFNFILFFCCGLIVGLEVFYGLFVENRNPSFIGLLMSWSAYTFLFVAIGKRSYLNSSVARCD